jgi:arginine repressor
MLFQSKERIKEKIVKLLAIKPYLSANEIHSQITSGGTKVTTQSIFKEIKKLQSDNIVLKVKQKYILNLAWTESMYLLLEKAQQSHSERGLLSNLLPEADNKSSVWFKNLIRMKSFWSHLVITLIKQSKENILYSWNPHPWFYLVQSNHQKQMIQAIRQNNTRMLKIVGYDTYLDKEAARYWSKENIKYSYAESPFSGQDEIYYSVIDDFVLKIELTKKMSHTIEEIYSSVNRNNFDLNFITESLSSPTKVKLQVINKPNYARKLKKKFNEFFD